MSARCDNEGYKFVVFVFNFTFMAVRNGPSELATRLFIFVNGRDYYILNVLRYTLFVELVDKTYLN